MALPLSREQGAPVLRVSRYKETGELTEVGAWTPDRAGAGCRGSIPAPATVPGRGAGREAEADRWRDAGKLGAAVAAVRMALRTGRRSPADPDSLAPSGFQAPLEREVPPGTATDSNGAEAAHPADGAGEPLWGQERIANEL